MSLGVKLVLVVVGVAIYAGIMVHCLTYDSWDKQ